MATFLQLVNEVQGEINKGGLALVEDSVKQSINDSIAYYEPQPFRFNQGFTSFSTVAGTEIYDLPADVVILRRAQILVTPTSLTRMEILGWELYQDRREGFNIDRGMCDECSVYGDQIYLYPTPSDVFTVKLWYVKRVADTPLILNASSNVWTNRARQLIKCRTKYYLMMHRVMNVEWATAYAQMEGNELLSLQGEFSQQSAPRRIEESF